MTAVRKLEPKRDPRSRSVEQPDREVPAQPEAAPARAVVDIQPPKVRRGAAAQAAEAPQLERSRDLSRLAQHGWIAGLAGCVVVITMGYLAARGGGVAGGFGVVPGSPDANLSMAFVLVVCALVMFAVELVVRLRVDRGRVLSIADDLREGRVRRFVGRCLLVYGIELGLLTAALFAFRHLNEYGYARNNAYYRPWFAVMESFRTVYLWIGLPYVLLTRALQHDPKADKKQAAFTVMKAARHLVAALAALARRPVAAPPPFERGDKSAILGLGVKFFFVPLMTVFFADQFTSLTKNWTFVLEHMGSGRRMSIREFHDVAYSVIFAIDVGLAWGGYVLSSRWIKNTLYSVEPTLLGWMVALLCYPPFNRVFGFYLSTPGENQFFGIKSQPAVYALAVGSVLSFIIYTSATVVFGLRFSNLTHRGIITTGPYSVVRHPAYAAKNFSWWCVMAPFAFYQLGQGYSTTLLLQIVGMVALSGMYAMRALTEERHLKQDPEYRAYMKKVPWRFIPGLV